MISIAAGAPWYFVPVAFPVVFYFTLRLINTWKPARDVFKPGGTWLEVGAIGPGPIPAVRDLDICEATQLLESRGVADTSAALRQAALDGRVRVSGKRHLPSFSGRDVGGGVFESIDARFWADNMIDAT